MKNLVLRILINLLLFQDDLSAWFWLFPFVLWEIIYSDQVCAGTTTPILYPRQRNLFPQNQKIFPSKIGKSSERGNLRNPGRAELQIRWKKILANPAPHGALLSSASSNWNHISRSIFFNHLRNAKKNEKSKCLRSNQKQFWPTKYFRQYIHYIFSCWGVAREGNLGEMGEWMNYVKQWKSFCSSRFVSVSSPQHETAGYSPTKHIK